MVLYLIFITVGVLLLIGAFIELKRKLAFVKSGERSVGTVVELVEKKDDDGTIYYPVFEFKTANNETITYRHGSGSSTARWAVGQEAAFIFEPGKPETARFLNYWGIYWWPLSLLAVAIDLLLIGAGYFLLRGYF